MLLYKGKSGCLVLREALKLTLIMCLGISGCPFSFGGDRLSGSRLKDEYMDQLFRAVLSLKNVEECYIFFEDLCTINELKAMVQRLEVARMLQEGYTYSQIERETGVSTATISRVKRYLYYGHGGYNIALERLKEYNASKGEEE